MSFSGFDKPHHTQNFGHRLKDMKFPSRAAQAATEVRDTAQKIGTTVQWNTAALIAVCLVSCIALVVSVAAINRSAA